MDKQRKFLMSSVAVSMVLVGCGNTSQGDVTPAGKETKFATEVTNEGTPIKGGTLRTAMVSSSPFSGILIDELVADQADGTLSGYVDEPMFDFDENRQLVNTGLASFEFDLENNTTTVKLNSADYKWSDGEPVTIDDYIFAYEGIGHKDYTGIRYDSDFKNVIGMEEYHNGDADSISGLEKIDELTVKIHYKKMMPSMRLAGGSLSAYIMPKHVFQNIPVADWEKSEAVRGTANVGLGAFVVESIVPGESVTYKANDNYYKGRPKVDHLVVEVVSPENIVSEVKAGNYDIAQMPNSQFESYKDLQNVTLVSQMDSGYEYIAFHLGKFDKSISKNVTEPNAKMSDPLLRQAIAYAIDVEQAGNAIYNGLFHGSNSIIIPFFKDVYNPDQEGFTYNPEKAKELLDRGGYKDVDGDGLRENKDGSKLTISFAARTRDDANEALIQQYLLWWKDVGLDVQLYTGRTIDVNNFYDKIEADDPDIDMFTAGWTTGYDPNPAGLYGEDAPFNYTRYVNQEGTDIMNKILSVDAFDTAKNKTFYYDWQKYVHDQAFVFPTLVGDRITAINKRVKYYSTGIASNDVKNAVNNIELLSETPVR